MTIRIMRTNAMQILELTRIGDAIDFILPQEVLTRLGLVPGDSLFVTDFPGGIDLTASDAELKEEPR